MAKKRAGTVPLVKAEFSKLEAEFSKLDDFDWKTQESAYGESLSREPRQRIFEATQRYVAFRIREINSPPLRDSVRRVERLKKCAESFGKALAEGDSNSMAHVWAHHEIELQFLDDYLVAPDSIVGLTRVVSSFVTACDTVLENHLKNKEQLDSIKAVGVPSADGTAWRIWIVELTSVMDEFGLPSAAPWTDTDAPFVQLVKKLEAQLPKKLQVPRNSDGALAKAIKRARQWRDKNSTT